MTLPGHEVDLVEAPPSIAALTDTGAVFAIGHATTPVSIDEVFSIEQFARTAGARDPASFLYDGLDSFFHEGGYKAYIATVGMSANEAALLALLENIKDDSLGIGQIIAPGITTPTAQLAIAEAAADQKKCAVLDGIDTATVATLIAQAAAITGHTTSKWGERFSSLFAPWDTAPGITSGTTRTIPPSGRICGNIARNQSNGETENTAAAGDLGWAGWVQGLSRNPWIDADRKQLNEAGINVSILRRNRVRTMGFRSLADQVEDRNWSWFQCSRLVMRIRLDLDFVAENFEFSKLDAKQHTINRFKGRISAALDKYSDDLFGATPQEAYVVDVGPAVNTKDTLANDELHAKVALRTTEAAERVIVEVAKVPDTESLPLAA